MHFYPVIQFLRGVFTLLVAVYHLIRHHDAAGNLLEEGHIMMKVTEPFSLLVYAFFMFSAFVVPMGIAGNGYSLQRFPAFLSRRFIRIQIPYLASMLCIIAVESIWRIRHGETPDLDVGKILSNFFYVAPLTGDEWYNIIYWTLCLEFQCYIVIGLLMPFFEKANRMSIVMLLGLWSIFPFFVNQHLLFFKYTAVFNMGLVLFLYYQNRLRATETAGLLLLSSVIIFLCMRMEILIIVLLSLALIHHYQTKPIKAAIIGEPSYSMYLIHGLSGGLYLILRNKIVPFEMPWYFHLAAALMTAVFSAILFYWLIEKPSARLARKIRLRKTI